MPPSRLLLRRASCTALGGQRGPEGGVLWRCQGKTALVVPQAQHTPLSHHEK